MLRYDARTFKDTKSFQPAGNSTAAITFENLPVHNGYGVDLFTAGRGTASMSLLKGPSFTLAFNLCMKTIPNATLFYADSVNLAPLTPEQTVYMRFTGRSPPNRARQEGVNIQFKSSGAANYAYFTVMGTTVSFALPGDEWQREPIFLAFSRAMDGTLSIWYNDRIGASGTSKSPEPKLVGDLQIQRNRNIQATLLGMIISGASALNEGELAGLRAAAMTDLDAASKQVSRTGAELSMPGFPAPAGLIFAIDAGNSRCYDSKTGPTTVKDLSVNSYTMRFEKPPKYDAENGLWSVTGNNRLTGPASSALPMLQDDDYTIVFRCSTSVMNQSSLFKLYGTATGGRAISATTTWTNSTLYYDQGGCCDSSQRLTAPVGNYYRDLHTYALVKSRAGRAIYIDGQLVAQTAVRGASAPLVARPLSIFTTDEFRIWSGSLSHFMIWNRGLSGNDLQMVHRYMAYPYSIRTATWQDADSYCRSMNMTLCDAQAICHRGYNGTVIDPARYVNVLAPVYGEENGWMDLTSCARVQRADTVSNAHVKCCAPSRVERGATRISTSASASQPANPYFDAISSSDAGADILKVTRGENVMEIGQLDGARRIYPLREKIAIKEFQRDINVNSNKYIIKGNSVYVYGSGKILSLAELGLPGTVSNVSAVMTIEGQDYFLSGKMAYRIESYGKPAIAKPIAEMFPGLPADFTQNIHAILTSFPQPRQVSIIKGQRLLVYEPMTRRVVRVGHVLDEMLILTPIVSPQEACRSIAAAAKRVGAAGKREIQIRLEAMLGECRTYTLKEYTDARRSLKEGARRNRQQAAKTREELKTMQEYSAKASGQLEQDTRLLKELDAQIAVVEKIRCPTPGVCQRAPEQQSRCTRKATELPADIRQHPDFYQYVERASAPKCRAPSSNTANMAQIQELQRYMSEIAALLEKIMISPNYQKISSGSITEVNSLLGSMHGDMQKINTGEDARYILDRLTATKTLIDRRLSEVRAQAS